MSIVALSPSDQRVRNYASDWLWVSALIRKHGNDPEEVRSLSRYMRLVTCRRAVAAQLRKEGWSLPRIGKALGGRHHTSVLWMLRGGRKTK